MVYDKKLDFIFLIKYNRDMKEKKIILGQFFTRNDIWLKSHIADFIVSSKCQTIYDPFAGDGDLLKISSHLGIQNVLGLDIDKTLGWSYNDSLEAIPHIHNAIIVTNPPYISNYSASRKKVIGSVRHYFEKSIYDDIYLIALEKMLEAQEYVVAIIPETFINSNFQDKKRLFSITILEENPFNDTDIPVIVACFYVKQKKESEINIYKNNNYIGSLYSLNRLRPTPKHIVDMKFNDKKGWLGLRAIDLTDPENMICFDYKDNIDYDWEAGIKASSRLYSLIDIDINYSQRNDFIKQANNLLSSLRSTSKDVILSPFKGNMKNGTRRRRLDFKTARAILEQAYMQLKGSENVKEQYVLF